MAGFQQWFEQGRAGVVDQGINAAEMRGHIVHGVGYLPGIGDIASNQQRRT